MVILDLQNSLRSHALDTTTLAFWADCSQASSAAALRSDTITLMTRIPRSALIGLTAILLGALSLRIPTTSLGPLLPEIRSSTGYGETLLSLLTSVPLAMTLLVAPISPWLASRLGRDRVLGFALVGITAGTLLRSVPGSIPLFAGTLILGFSIATATVLLPAAISAESAELRARFTGVYSMALSLGFGVGSDGPHHACQWLCLARHAHGLGWLRDYRAIILGSLYSEYWPCSSGG